MTYNYTIRFSAAYGEGAYGTSVYSCANNTTDAACTTSTGAAGTTGTNGLANTGTMVVLFASIACLIIFVALVVRIWKRKPVAQAVQVSAEPVADRDVRS